MWQLLFIFLNKKPNPTVYKGKFFDVDNEVNVTNI